MHRHLDAQRRLLFTAYRRYLVNRFIEHFGLRGTPLFVDFRDSENPFKDRKNKLTARQLQKRRRLKKFTGRKSRKSR